MSPNTQVRGFTIIQCVIEKENGIHETEQVFMNCKMVNCEKVKHKPVSRKSKKERHQQEQKKMKKKSA